jgi:hypothetical protein
VGLETIVAIRGVSIVRPYARVMRNRVVTVGLQRRSKRGASGGSSPPKGGTVPCHYVEGKPELVVVFHERKGGVLLGFGIGLIVLATGAYFASRKKAPPA